MPRSTLSKLTSISFCEVTMASRMSLWLLPLIPFVARRSSTTHSLSVLYASSCSARLFASGSPTKRSSTDSRFRFFAGCPAASASKADSASGGGKPVGAPWATSSPAWPGAASRSPASTMVTRVKNRRCTLHFHIFSQSSIMASEGRTQQSATKTTAVHPTGTGHHSSMVLFRQHPLVPFRQQVGLCRRRWLYLERTCGFLMTLYWGRRLHLERTCVFSHDRSKVFPSTEKVTAWA